MQRTCAKVLTDISGRAKAAVPINPSRVTRGQAHERSKREDLTNKAAPPLSSPDVCGYESRHWSAQFLGLVRQMLVMGCCKVVFCELQTIVSSPHFSTGAIEQSEIDVAG